MTTSFSSPPCVQCSGGRWSGRLESVPRGCSTSEAYFLHCPESAHKNSILNTFTHTSIPIRRACSSKKKNKEQNAQLTKHDSFVYWSSSCPMCSRRRPGSLAPAPHDCPTSEVFSPTTVLTENICRRVQQIFQHRPPTIPFLTNSTITSSCKDSLAPQDDSW